VGARGLSLSFLARSDPTVSSGVGEFVHTFIERDLQQLGFMFTGRNAAVLGDVGALPRASVECRRNLPVLWVSRNRLSAVTLGYSDRSLYVPPVAAVVSNIKKRQGEGAEVLFSGHGSACTNTWHQDGAGVVETSEMRSILGRPGHRGDNPGGSNRRCILLGDARWSRKSMVIRKNGRCMGWSARRVDARGSPRL